MDRKELVLTYLGVSLVLSLFGLLMIFSASSAIATERMGSPYYFVKKEVFFLLLSILVFLASLRLPLRIIEKLSVPLVFLSLLFLALPLIPSLGVKAGGAKRWIKVLGFSLQPSEFVKPVFAVYLASYISRGKRMLLPPLLLLLAASILLLLEPDLGCVVFLTVFTFASLFAGGIKLKKFIIPGILAATMITFLIVTKGYRVTRIKAFMNPWMYRTGCGYQLVQSFISFGSGGLFGKGIGKGTEKLFYLPEPHTDFIFAVIGEELGFTGVFATVFLFFILFFSGYKLSVMEEGFRSFLILNVTLLITIQALIHMAVNLGLLPPKGIPLPFISYGGSSLLSAYISLGMAVRASLEG